jgi:putative glutathione S-transferase
VVDGQWQIGGRKPDTQGRFVRRPTRFHDRITADGSSGHPAEAGRYHLYVSWACPWAHRTLILRKLLGLEKAISLSVVDSLMGEKGWEFTANPGATEDHLFGRRYLHQVYIQAMPGYTGRASVPVLFDKVTGSIVNNESREIVRMFDTECGAISENVTTDSPAPFLPPGKEAEVDAAIDAFYEPVNNGVYKSGFATTQEAYEEAVGALFDALGHWEAVLGRQRYLCGDKITEADWCLFTTLVRFDPVYHYHFKCNRHRLRDYPNLWNYTRELFQVPGVAETCNMTHIKHHYFASHGTVNPTGIVPVGPEIDYTTPHDRERAYGG